VPLSVDIQTLHDQEINVEYILRGIMISANLTSTCHLKQRSNTTVSIFVNSSFENVFKISKNKFILKI